MKMTPKTHSGFFQAVYEIVALIPAGKVTTYGAIANCIGSKQSARMVGWALNQLPYPHPYPAHRVVNRNGLLTGKAHFHPSYSMEELLALEGIIVKNNRVEDFEKIFWDPNQAITDALPFL